MATTVDTLLVRIEADMSDLRKDLAKVAKQTEQRTTQMADGFRKVKNAIVAIGGTALFGSFLKSTIQTGAQIEALEVQMEALLGSAEEGGKAFENMRRFASKVPFSLRQIQQGAGGLAAASNNADELNELLQITGNIAAQFNIPFEEAAANVQRALSAGAGAADQFRDRGVLAFAGFKAGVSYNAKETAQILQDTFGTGGTADGAMDKFAQTTSGALSMLGDAVFNFQAIIAQSGLNKAFVDLTNQVTGLINSSQYFAAVIGVILGRALSIIGVVIENVISHMRTLIFVFGTFAAMSFATVIGGAVRRFIALAKAIRAAGVAQVLFNKISRRNILAITFVGAALALAGGKLEAFEEAVGNAFDAAMQALPSQVKQTIDELADEIDKAAQAIGEAEEEERDTDPRNVRLGGTGVDTKALLDLQKLINSINGSTKSLTDDLEKLRKIGKNSELFADAQEAIRRLEHQLQYETQPIFAAFVDGAIALGDSVQSAFRQMLDGTEITMTQFTDMLKSAVRDTIAQIFRLTVINRVLNAIFPGLGLQTSTFGQIMGRAGGGPVTRGSPYLVGERGPELFVPQGAGSVVNAATTRGMSGEPVVVNQTFNVSTGVQQTVRAEIRSLMPQIADSAKAAVADAKRRGGSYGRNFA